VQGLSQRQIAEKLGINRSTLLGFALHYGFKPEVAPSYAAWVKGKVDFYKFNFIKINAIICRHISLSCYY